MFFTVTLEDSTKLSIQLWNTAGQERSQTIASLYTRDADVIVFCYSVTDAEGIKRLQDLDVPEARKNSRAPDVFFVLLGLQADAGKDAATWPDRYEPSVHEPHGRDFSRSRQVTYVRATTSHRTNRWTRVSAQLKSPPFPFFPPPQQDEGEEYSRSIGAEFFLETSAKTKENNAAFVLKIAEVWRRRRVAAGLPVVRPAPAKPSSTARRAASRKQKGCFVLAERNIAEVRTSASVHSRARNCLGLRDIEIDEAHVWCNMCCSFHVSHARGASYLRKT